MSIEEGAQPIPLGSNIQGLDTKTTTGPLVTQTVGLRGIGPFGLDCNSQAFGIPKGLNLVAVGELRDAHGSRINILPDPEKGQTCGANVIPSGSESDLNVFRGCRSAHPRLLTHILSGWRCIQTDPLRFASQACVTPNLGHYSGQSAWVARPRASFSALGTVCQIGTAPDGCPYQITGLWTLHPSCKHRSNSAISTSPPTMRGVRW